MYTHNNSGSFTHHAIQHTTPKGKREGGGRGGERERERERERKREKRGEKVKYCVTTNQEQYFKLQTRELDMCSPNNFWTSAMLMETLRSERHML